MPANHKEYCYHIKKLGYPFYLWLKKICSVKEISFHQIALSSPTDFTDIYRSANDVIKQKKAELKKSANFTFLLSPGTPAMAAVWIILSKTKYPAILIESSRDHGVKTVSIPFDISADFIPGPIQTSDDRLVQLAAGLSNDPPAFADIIHRSKTMQRVIVKARLAAARSIPVLIEGESGTGKELLAQAVHADSPRSAGPLITINCGAIPEELIESELFGHEKGAFTGAVAKRQGHFVAAHTGTLFLDEIGELPVSMQVKLLRVLQEGEVKPVGATKAKTINVRIIAATNKDLLKETIIGNFREDLFYRLAVAVLKLPPLRERSGDLTLLIDTFMDKINRESGIDSAKNHKNISASARNLLLQHPWPGNIRELLNTLTRATIWSAGATIQEVDIREALLPVMTPRTDRDSVMDKPVEQGIDLPTIMQKVAAHYLTKGLEATHGNKTRTAALLGLPSYQTLTNWLKKYGLE